MFLHQDTHPLLPKDCLSTAEGLYFSVVLHGLPGRSVCCSLRYMSLPDGSHCKLDTAQAFDFLKEYHPQFLSCSDQLDAETILVPPEAIHAVFRPVETPERIQSSCRDDQLKQTALQIIGFLTVNDIPRSSIGITGSLMLDFHNPDSDIDIVIYDPQGFSHARQAIKDSMHTGQILSLDDAFWHETWLRRSCTIDFEEYKKHETRKYNKFLMNGTKVDISYVPVRDDIRHATPVSKQGPGLIKASVIDDSHVFSYPARYITDHEKIREILCYTATYTGQAFNGESIEASGMIEQDADGRQYMVIGTSREAPDEYLKVLDLY